MRARCKGHLRADEQGIEAVGTFAEDPQSQPGRVRPKLKGKQPVGDAAREALRRATERALQVLREPQQEETAIVQVDVPVLAEGPDVAMAEEVPFAEGPIRAAIKRVASHHAGGRVVINLEATGTGTG